MSLGRVTKSQAETSRAVHSRVTRSHSQNERARVKKVNKECHCRLKYRQVESSRRMVEGYVESSRTKVE